MINRGFRRKHPTATSDRVPPGQYVTEDFPVLSAGPTPRISLDTWTFALEDPQRREIYRLDWNELRALPATEVVVDIHCVTKWSKVSTRWKGVAIDALLAAAGVAAPAPYVMAFCSGGYTTNLALDDLRREGSLVAYEYAGAPLDREHGGPVRLLVPHLYFWKSAKWLRGLRFMDTDEPGFWESHGYHLRGDPWTEQRYDGD
jgi:DMSO/TMAO reductase YedYZ molybdopterin-dependent catalytic subunit